MTPKLVLALGLILVLATPADAIHKGRVCKTFPSADGAGGAHLTACLVVNDHDFQDQIQAMIVLTNSGSQDVRVHVSYLRLIKGSTTIRDTGPFQITVPDHQAVEPAGGWVVNPNGTFHSRIRMWPEWIEQPGDPTGSILAWNSGSVTY